MQQGIRMCKGDESIWVEYYRLELLYVAKLLARREVLGLDAAGAWGPGRDTPAARPHSQAA